MHLICRGSRTSESVSCLQFKTMLSFLISIIYSTYCPRALVFESTFVALDIKAVVDIFGWRIFWENELSRFSWCFAVVVWFMRQQSAACLAALKIVPILLGELWRSDGCSTVDEGPSYYFFGNRHVLLSFPSNAPRNRFQRIIHLQFDFCLIIEATPRVFMFFTLYIGTYGGWRRFLYPYQFWLPWTTTHDVKVVVNRFSMIIIFCWVSTQDDGLIS